jgi:hypothetical protein
VTVLMGVVFLVGCSNSDRESAKNALTSAVTSLSSQAQQAADQAKSRLGDASHSVRESALRNAVALGAAAKFKSAGVDVHVPLDCTASSPSTDQFTVNCTGTTTDGKAVTVTGNDTPQSKPTFAGSVAGQQVWTDCLGFC